MRQRYELTNRAIALLLAFFLVFGNSSTFAEYLVAYSPETGSEESAPLEPPEPEEESEESAPLEPTEPEEPPLENGTGESGEIVEPPEESYPPDYDDKEKPDDGQNEEEPDYTYDDDDDENNDYADLDVEDDLDSDDYYDYDYYEDCDCSCEGGYDCSCDCDEYCDCGCEKEQEEPIDDVSVFFYADGAGTLSANGLSVDGEDSSGEELYGLTSGEVVTFFASPNSLNAEIEWSISGVEFASGGNPGDTMATIIIPNLEVTPIDEVTVHVAFSGQATIHFSVTGGFLLVPELGVFLAGGPGESRDVDISSPITIFVESGSPDTYPLPNWAYSGGTLSGNPRDEERVLTVQGDGHVHVSFISESFSLTFDSSQIAASVSGTTVSAGTTVSFSLGPFAPTADFILWRAEYDDGSSFLGHGLTASLNMPAFDTRVYLETRPGFPVTFSVTDGASTMTATWSEPDLGSPSFDTGDIVPQGSTVTFSVEPPADTTGFLGYEWTVNGIPQLITQSSTFQLPGTLQTSANVTVTLVRGYVVEFSSNISATQTLGGVTSAVTSGNLVRAGSQLNFTAQNHGLTHVFAYEWEVNGVTAIAANESMIISYLNLDVDVQLTVVRGFNVTYGFTVGSTGTLNLTPSTPPTGGLFREGAALTFTADPDDDALSFTWFIDGVAVPGETSDVFVLQLTPDLSSDLNVTVSFSPGVAVTYGVRSAASTGTISATLAGGVPLPTPPVIEEGTQVIFTATPQTTPPHTIAGWFINDTATTAGVSGNTLTLNVAESSFIEVEFVPIVLTLTPDASTITGPGTENVAMGGNATGVVSFSNHTFTPADPGYPENTPGNAWPAGLSYGVSGDTIIISSSGLTFRNNGVYTVVVTRQGVTATLTVNVNIPVPTVTEVEIDPENPSVAINSSQAFLATVIGEHNPPQGVTWTISGQTHIDTLITASGMLFIAQDEAATSITVRATSDFTTTNPPPGQVAVYGETIVNVINPVVDLEIVDEPTNLEYRINETLDLNGLVVRVIRANGTYTDVGFAAFGGTSGLTTDPEHGTVLTLAHDGTSVRITHTDYDPYVDTAQLTVTNPVIAVEIASQPDNMTFVLGEELDLTGLIVDLIREYGPREPVAFANFGGNGLTTSPLAGTIITAAHDNTPVLISHTDGPTVNTANISVRARVTFDPDGGVFADETLREQLVALGGNATPPTITRPGFSREGWYTPDGSYTGVTTNRTITAEWGPIPVERISIATQPSRLSYMVGEALDLAGLVVELTFVENSGQPPLEVAFDDFATFGLSTNPIDGSFFNAVTPPEGTPVRVTHIDGPYADTAPIVVTDPIVSITIITQPLLEYNHGEPLNLSALGVTLERASGATVDNVGFSDFSANGLSTSLPNGTTLNMSHNGTAIQITHADNPPPANTGLLIIHNHVVSIALETQPTSLTYDVEDSLSLDGMSVRLNFADGSHQIVAASAFGYNNNLSASPEQGDTITATHHGNPIVVTYTPASGRPQPSPATVSTANLTVYATVTFDLAGGSCGDDGDLLEQRNIVGFNAVLPVVSRPGFTPHSVTPWLPVGDYNNITTNRTVTAQWERLTVSSLSIITQPTTRDYIFGQELDLTGILVRLNFVDSSYHDVSFDEFGTYYLSATPSHGTTLNMSHNDAPIVITYTDEDSTLTGMYPLSVNTYNLTIADLVDSIAVQVQPTRLIYDVNQQLDLSGLSVRLTRLSGAYFDVPFSQFGANSLSANPVQNTTMLMTHNYTPVVITYSGTTNDGTVRTAATDNLTVINPVTSIEVTTQPRLVYIWGNELDLTSLVVRLNFVDGPPQYVSFADFGTNLSAHLTSGTPPNLAHGSAVNMTHDDSTVLVTFTGITTDGSSRTANSSAITVTDPVNSITVFSQPTQLVYNSGDALNLDGLVVTLHRNSGTTNVGFTDFGTNELSVSLANGTTLLWATYNGSFVRITHADGPHVDTDQLTVRNFVEGVYIHTVPPAILDYDIDDVVNIAGLSVRLVWREGSDTIVASGDFGANNLAATLGGSTAAGLAVTAVHDNLPIAITYTPPASVPAFPTPSPYTVSTETLAVHARVTFDPAGGSWYSGGALEQRVRIGGNATEPVVRWPGFVFDSWLTPNGGHTNVNSHRTITADWIAVPVTDIGIRTQPELVYNLYNDYSLNLSALVVVLTFDDSVSPPFDVDVPFERFGLYSLSATPTHGATLTMANNGLPVEIEFSGAGGPHFANTNNLQIINPVVSMAVTTQPTLSYTALETLDLNSLVLTLTLADNTSQSVPFANFAANNLTAAPSHGTVVTIIHDGQPVVISYAHTVGPSIEPISTNNLSVTRLPGADIATPAVERSVTRNSITVYSATLDTAETGQTIEYAVSLSGSAAPTTGWQSGLTFAGLDPDTSYIVWARSAQSDTHSAGSEVPSLDITTLPLPIVLEIVAHEYSIEVSALAQVRTVSFSIIGNHFLNNEDLLSGTNFGVTMDLWISPQNRWVEVHDNYSATLFIDLNISVNSSDADRNFTLLVGFGNPLNPPNGSVNITQLAAVYREVIIRNSPAGTAPSGQSGGGTFMQGSKTRLIEGSRGADYTFSHWESSEGTLVPITGSNNVYFYIPDGSGNIEITAYWIEDEPIAVPPPVVLPPPIVPPPIVPPPVVPPPVVPPAIAPPPGQGDTGSSTGGTKSDAIDESGGTSVGEVPPETGNGGDVPPELGNGSGQSSEEGNNTDVSTPAPNNYPNTVEEQGRSFMNWLSFNIWWIAILISALVIIVTWWFNFGKKRKKDVEEAIVVDLTDED